MTAQHIFTDCDFKSEVHPFFIVRTFTDSKFRVLMHSRCSPGLLYLLVSGAQINEVEIIMFSRLRREVLFEVRWKLVGRRCSFLKQFLALLFLSGFGTSAFGLGLVDQIYPPPPPPHHLGAASNA